MNILPVHESKGAFFKVLQTTDKSQVAVMTIGSGGDSGPEDIHTGDQIVYVIEGEARVIVSGEEARVEKGEAVVIPTGAQHHIYNDGKETLFFLSIYTPPQY